MRSPCSAESPWRVAVGLVDRPDLKYPHFQPQLPIRAGSDVFQFKEVFALLDQAGIRMRLRMRSRGGPGGHRGMESVIANLKSDRIARLRLGIGAPDGVIPEDDLSEYVLEPTCTRTFVRLRDPRWWRSRR